MAVRAPAALVGPGPWAHDPTANRGGPPPGGAPNDGDGHGIAADAPGT